MERYPPESTVRRRNSEATETLPPIGSQTSWPGDDGADGLLNETAAPLYSAFGGMASSQSGPISTPVQFLRDGELRDALLSYNYAVFAAANNTELLLSRTGRYGQIMPAIFHTNRTELLRDPLPKSTRRAAPPLFSRPQALWCASAWLALVATTVSQSPSLATPFATLTPSFPDAPTGLGQERKLRSRISKPKCVRPPTPKPERSRDGGSWSIRCPVAGCGHVQGNKRVCDMRRHLNHHFPPWYLCGIPVAELDEEEFEELQTLECTVGHCDELNLDYMGGCGKVFTSKKSLTTHFETNQACYRRL
ncbi:hypothetical protein ONZ51_g4765 [Trametes cubensis]|uniref:C2H2-type domain-containing protein n=1 Tax=Trametes cubensis TaxID=1111947 RepID=A0AAD7TVA5_9APHY|nr:hypothetical protein ONZ51_g4765 [Trametes cubensis]